MEKDIITIKNIVSKPKSTALSTTSGFEKLPSPLFNALRQFDQEISPFRKVHRLIDAIEVFIKLHTVFVVSRYFGNSNLPEEIKEFLYDGLRTPSLGIWWSFAREFARFSASCKLLLNEEKLIKVLLPKGAVFKCFENDNNLISFRNGYAHGSTPRDEKCTEDINKYSPILMKMIESCGYLTELILFTFICKNDPLTEGMNTFSDECLPNLLPGRTYLAVDGIFTDLHPLLVYRKDSGCYFFYNDLRKNDVSIINYDNSLHERDAILRQELLDKYPLDQRKGKSPDKFKEMVEYLTETFKGRRKELHELLNFLSSKRTGFLFIWGGPGVGKSALLARIIQILSWSPEIRGQAGIEENIFLNKIHVIEYLIRRDMGSNKTEDMINYLLLRLDKNFKLNYKPGRTIKEQNENLRSFLQEISGKIPETERVVLVIDGLDEAVEVPELLDALPRILPDKILAIYSSRRNQEVERIVYDNLDRENRSKTSLCGLSIEDTRAILYEYTNKYKLDPEYVETIVKKSEGNPLFIKLLCLGLENRDYKLNDIINLPGNLNDIYRNIFERLHKNTPGSLEFLRMLASAKDFVSAQMVSEVLNLDIDILLTNILKNCGEVLIEKTIVSNGVTTISYQLFHESLRDYIKASGDYAKSLREINLKIIAWGQEWESLDGTSQVYALRYLLSHMMDEHLALIKSEKTTEVAQILDRMISIIENPKFQKTAFLKIGNTHYINIALKGLQLILKGQNENEKILRRIINYSVKMHSVREELYTEQLKNLLIDAKAMNLEHLIDYSQMGALPKDRVMLLLLGLWHAGALRMDNPLITNQIKEWMEDVHDISIKAFVELSI
jgi:hypothetical protein